MDEFAFTGLALANDSAEVWGHRAIVVFVFRAVAGNVNDYIRRDGMLPYNMVYLLSGVSL